MDTPLLLVGMSSEDSARAWVYPELRYSDRLLLAARVMVAHTTHLFCLIDREGVLCMVSGTHHQPCDHPDLGLAEDPSGSLLLVTAARHHLLDPEVAAVLGRRCTDADVAAALTSDMDDVREAVLRALPQLRKAWGNRSTK